MAIDLKKIEDIENKDKQLTKKIKDFLKKTDPKLFVTDFLDFLMEIEEGDVKGFVGIKDITKDIEKKVLYLSFSFYDSFKSVNVSSVVNEYKKGNTSILQKFKKDIMEEAYNKIEDELFVFFVDDSFVKSFLGKDELSIREVSKYKTTPYVILKELHDEIIDFLEEQDYNYKNESNEDLEMFLLINGKEKQVDDYNFMIKEANKYYDNLIKKIR